MSRKNKFLQNILHLFIGIALVLKGFNKISHHPVLGGLILSFGLVILAYFVYLSITQKESRTMHISIHLFEAFASVFTAYIFFMEGKKYLPYVFLLAATGFFISVYLYMKNHRKSRSH